jgi:hypothetical protein
VKSIDDNLNNTNMDKKSIKKVVVSDAQKLGIGVGLTTAAVAAAGAYFLYGSKDSSDNRKKVKSGILRAKAEVLETLENAQEITEEEFHSLVEGVAKSYSVVKSLSQKDLKEFKADMADNWEDLVSSGAAKVMTIEQIAKKVAKRGEKEPVAKAAQKKAVKKAPAKKVVAKKAAPKKVAKK